MRSLFVVFCVLLLVAVFAHEKIHHKKAKVKEALRGHHIKKAQHHSSDHTEHHANAHTQHHANAHTQHHANAEHHTNAHQHKTQHHTTQHHSHRVDTRHRTLPQIGNDMTARIFKWFYPHKDFTETAEYSEDCRHLAMCMFIKEVRGEHGKLAATTKEEVYNELLSLPLPSHLLESIPLKFRNDAEGCIPGMEGVFPAPTCQFECIDLPDGKRGVVAAWGDAHKKNLLLPCSNDAECENNEICNLFDGIPNCNTDPLLNNCRCVWIVANLARCRN